MPKRLQSRILFGLLIWFAWFVPAATALEVLAGPIGFDPSDRVIRDTGRFAVMWWCLTAMAVAVMWRRGQGIPRAVGKVIRWFYVLGCTVYLIHVAVAFHAGHGWSHAAAFDHVQRQTGFGPGLFVSYLFTLVWVVDAAWCLASIDTYRSRPRWATLTVHAFMAFVVFNATVAFGGGVLRWLGVWFLCLPVFFLATPRDRRRRLVRWRSVLRGELRP